MALVSVRQCDICGDPISPAVRRLSLEVTLGIHNGDSQEHSRSFPDLCSEKCLMTGVTSLLDHAAKWPVTS